MTLEPSEPFERALRHAAKDWPLDHERLRPAAMWALLKMFEGQDHQLVDEVLTQLEDGRLDLGVCEDLDDKHVVITLADRPLVAIARKLVAAPPQG
jgi:hypothetical protein